MRKFVLALTMAAFVALPAFAQLEMLRAMEHMILASPEVQKELKLSDDQKETITKATAELRKAGFGGGTKAVEEYAKAMAKVREGLKEAQATRLLGIEAQQAETRTQANFFEKEAVQKALKFTDKQKDTVKDTITEMNKDLKELFDDAKDDFMKGIAAFRKMQTMNKEAYEKITKTLTDDQKKAWKDLKGEKFELNLNPFGKAKKKKDDF